MIDLIEWISSNVKNVMPQINAFELFIIYLTMIIEVLHQNKVITY